ncbi:hypothetical protein Gpo141_00003513 [Globisporangium polare]
MPQVSGADNAQQDRLQPVAEPAADTVNGNPQEQQSPRVQKSSTTLAKTALAKELEALELMIVLQQKKLALLEKIRSKALSEYDIADPAAITHSTHAHRAKHQSNEHFEDLIERKIEAMTASAVEELTANHLGQTASFKSLFVAKAVIPMGQLQQQQNDKIVDMKMMKLRPGGHQELLVLAYANGAIEFYLPPSPLLLLRIKASGELFIRAVELDLQSDLPSLVVVYEQPQAVVYALELTQNGRHLMGNQEDNATLIPTSTTETSKPVFTSALGTPFSLKVVELSRIQLTSAPSAIAITKTARRSVLAIGDEDGSLQFFALNGTLLHKMATNASIQSMAAQRNLVAFSNGSSTVLLPLAQGRDAAFVVCEGSTAQVTSIALDPVHFDVVYAGTSDGEVLVFATKDSGGESPGGACQIVSRVLLRDQTVRHYRQSNQQKQTNTRVYALRGFVIASSDSSVAVYNVSRAQDGVVSMEIVCSLPTTGKPVDHPLAVSEGNFVTNVALVSNPTASGAEEGTVAVFQSLLSTRTEKSDTSWVGVLYIGIVLAVVLLCQFCCRGRQQRPPSQTSSAYDTWEALRSRREAEFAGAGNARGPTSFGLGDPGTREESGGDLEHLSQEMRASMNARTARDVAGKQGRTLKRPPSTRPLSDRERFGPSYDALSDDLKRKIAEARQSTLECAFDDPEDDDDNDDDDEGF